MYRREKRPRPDATNAVPTTASRCRRWLVAPSAVSCAWRIVPAPTADTTRADWSWSWKKSKGRFPFRRGVLTPSRVAGCGSSCIVLTASSPFQPAAGIDIATRVVAKRAIRRRSRAAAGVWLGFCSASGPLRPACAYLESVGPVRPPGHAGRCGFDGISGFSHRTFRGKYQK